MTNTSSSAPVPPHAGADRDRLRGLLAATRVIAADLDLDELLRRIVASACDLVGARYGALGVVARDGSLGELLAVGVDDETARRIGHFPQGEGLLGRLVRHPEPLRLADLSEHADSVGFPAGHPPMGSFLGVPVLVRGEVFGNLYLTEKNSVDGTSGEFTQDDEDLVVALAATAGVLVANARLYETAERRQRWLRVSADIVRDLVAGRSAPLELVAGQARAAAEADLALVLQVDESEDGRLLVVAADGRGASRLVGTSWVQSETLSGPVFADDMDVVFPDAADAGMDTSVPGVPCGPAMMVQVPLAEGHRRAMLVVLRRTAAREFSQDDLEMAADFTGHVALAMELGRAQDDRRRLALADDRDRIARDLHDRVIQQLFASGLRLSALAGRTTEPTTADVLHQVVAAGDDSIREIRSTIYQLTRVPAVVDVRAVVTPVVEEIGELLPDGVVATFDVPLHARVAAETGEHLVAVVRELLSNCARHANAREVTLHVRQSASELVLTVADDGIGMAPGGRRSGLANVEDRARGLGGSCVVTSPITARGRGTRTTWRVPLSS